MTERTGARAGTKCDVEAAPLKISLTLRSAPLPKAIRWLAVNKVIRTTVNRTGDKFSANLLKHLNATAAGAQGGRCRPPRVEKLAPGREEPEIEEAFDRLVEEGADRLQRPLVSVCATGS